MIKRLVVILIILTACGCYSGFEERHYFKFSTAGSEIPNYYRLKVEGCSFISSSRYLSGYFDEDTINTYFNEFAQPTGGALVPPSRSPETNEKAGNQNAPNADKKNTPADDQKKQNGKDKNKQPAVDLKAPSLQPLAANLQGKNLVMILSSNSEDVANQISALASSKQFTASLAGILARDQYTAADSAENRLVIEKSRAKTTSELAKQVSAGLDKDKTVEETEDILIGLINALASDLGYEGAFTNLKDAEQWLRFSRSRLLRGDR
jgi:hypothetical protein